MHGELVGGACRVRRRSPAKLIEGDLTFTAETRVRYAAAQRGPPRRVACGPVNIIHRELIIDDSSDPCAIPSAWTRGPGPARPTGEAKLAQRRHGSGQQLGAGPPVQRAGDPHPAAAPRRGVQGRSRPARAPDQQHRRPDRPRARGAAPGPQRRQAQRRAVASPPPSCASIPRAPTRSASSWGAARSTRSWSTSPAGCSSAAGWSGRSRCPRRRWRSSAESVAACAGWSAARPARLAGLGVAVPYNLGSWQRELDIPLAAYRRWNEFDLGAAADRRDRARRVLRERRHGRGGGRAVPGPGPHARRLPLRVHRRRPRRRGGAGRRLSSRRSTPTPATSA